MSAPAKAAAPKPPYGDVALENRIGNKISYDRLQQIRKILLHFNWGTERASLLMQLAAVDVYGDIDHEAQTGSFYDYREQGWIVARIVPRDEGSKPWSGHPNRIDGDQMTAAQRLTKARG